MKKIILITLCFSIGLATNAQRYAIDPGHTAVVSKVMRFGVVKVVGRFNSVSGTINFNPANLSGATAEISIKTDSYTANNEGGENAVKSSQFLDAGKFPEIKMTLKSLTKSDKNFIVLATITLHGITKDISFPVSINGPMMDLPTQKQSLGISGLFTINRQDFGMTMNRKLPSGAEVIGNEVEIEINALALAE